LVAVAAFPPLGAQLYEYGGVPPAEVACANPSQPPKHFGLPLNEIADVNTVGEVMVVEA
jgi:hypothetical protein